MHTRIVSAAAVAASVLALGASSAQAQTIQPGVAIESGGSFCTLAWIFDGGGNVYGSSAAHCFGGVGQVVNLASGALGSTVERIGTVAFIGNANEAGRDYAFVRIDPEDHGKVSGALKGHPSIPTGISTPATASQGDTIQFSGHGVGFTLTKPTQEERIGILNGFDAQQHSVLGPVISGDSGGPVANVSDGNKAFGIVNTVGVGVNSNNLAIVHAGEGGNNLSFVLSDAASRGFGGLSLRTA